MAWISPHHWALADGTPTHTQWNQELISNPASLRHANDAQVKVYRSSNFTITNDSRQSIDWNAQDYEDSGMFDLGNPKRLIAIRSGIYLLQTKIPWATNTTGRRGVGYRINGAGLDYDMQFTSASSPSRQNGSDLVKLKSGQWVEVYAYQNSGAGLAITGTGEASSSATLTLVATPNAAPPWTAPRDWADNDVFTPQLLNTHIYDQLLNLRYFKGQGAKVSLKENTSVSKGERNPINWDVEHWGVGSLWTGGSQFTAAVAGWYLVLLTVEWRSEGTSELATAIRGCGFTPSTTGRDHDLHFQSGDEGAVSTNGKGIIFLPKGESVEMYAYHTSEASLTINGARDRTRACVVLLAA